MKHTPRAVKQYGGRMIARGSDPETLEGRKEDRRIVILEFPSMEQAKAFYHSREYGHAKQFRAGAATVQMVAASGYSDKEWSQAVEASERSAP